MTELRLYSVRTGPLEDECDGCHAPIAAGSPAVMREDRALFCNTLCACQHDDAPVGCTFVRMAL